MQDNKSVTEVSWTEEFRPDTLDEIRGNEEIVNRFKEWVDDESLPHVLLSGKQGIGKTALTVAFAREKYGDNWRLNTIRLNASDERGIETVREKIKSNAQKGTLTDDQFKILILDEADAMSQDGQTALRRVMEKYVDVTRFILMCNYPNQIIDPIKSRCACFRMSPLSTDEMVGLLEDKLDTKGIVYETDALREIAEASQGDARHALQEAQKCTISGKLEVDTVEALVGSLKRSDVEEIVEEALVGEYDKAREKTDTLLEDGVSPQELCDSIAKEVERSDIPADGKMKCIDKIAEAEWRIHHGSHPYLQVHNCLAQIRVGQYVSLDNYE